MAKDQHEPQEKVNRRCTFPSYFCSSKLSSKQVWQNWIYFLDLHRAIDTYNMAAATLNIYHTSAEAIITQLCMCNYAAEPYPHTKFHYDPSRDF